MLPALLFLPWSSTSSMAIYFKHQRLLNFTYLAIAAILFFFPATTPLTILNTPENWFLTNNLKLRGTNADTNTLTGLLQGKPIPALSIGILFRPSNVITFPISSNNTNVGIYFTLNLSPRYCPRCPMASSGGNANQFICVKYCPKESTSRHRDIHTISNWSFLPRRVFILL